MIRKKLVTVGYLVRVFTKSKKKRFNEGMDVTKGYVQEAYVYEGRLHVVYEKDVKKAVVHDKAQALLIGSLFTEWYKGPMIVIAYRCTNKKTRATAMGTDVMTRLFDYRRLS